MTRRIAVVAVFIAILWIVEAVNVFSDRALMRYGVLPRTFHGLIGIVCMPFLHAGFPHLVANTLPLLTMGSVIISSGVFLFLEATAFIVFLSGAGVWLIGREAMHVGASGLIFGYFGFLIARGWFDRRIWYIIVSLAILVVYGGIIWGVLPTNPVTSWEGHLMGLLAGILAAKLSGKSGRRQPAAE